MRMRMLNTQPFRSNELDMRGCQTETIKFEFNSSRKGNGRHKERVTGDLDLRVYLSPTWRNPSTTSLIVPTTTK